MKKLLGNLLLIGGGGHCASCIDAIESTGIWKISGIIDMVELKGQEILGYPVIGSDDDLSRLSLECENAVITVGQIESSDLRKKLFSQTQKNGFRFPSIIAASASVSRHSAIMEGTVILHHASVNARATIGENCIVNTGAIIEHDAIIGSHCHVSTGALVNGGCRVGEGCFIGSGAVLKNGVTLGSGVVVGTGAVVVKDIPDMGVYAGNPARKLK